MTSIIKTKLKPVLEFLSQLECALSKRWVSAAHLRLQRVQWSLPPQPEHFDHDIDLYYQWRNDGVSYWLERGVFSSIALKGQRVLELGCGDGFNAKNFYSPLSQEVIACDFDTVALATAKKKNAGQKITYILADIRENLPEGRFDNIIWDASIEHFTPEEISRVLQKIKSRLTSDGILSGHTIVELPSGKKSLSHHEYEFKDKADLARFFTPHFKNVYVFETIHPTRHNLYFWASDGILPFSDRWSKGRTN